MSPGSTWGTLHACHGKTSRKFYDTFGDELTNELVEWFNQVDATYRAELRARIGMAEGRLARLTLLLWIMTLGTIVALLKL